MTVWFWADPHIGHANIVRLCDRPYGDVEEMNEALLENYNSVVKPTDSAYWLGDIALGKIAETLPLVGLFNGYKLLVPGNHDRIFSGEKQKSIDRFLPEYSKVFQQILPEVTTFTAGKRTILLSHFPYQGDHTENDRHVDKRPVNRGLPLVHGHIHGLRKTEGRMLNCGVDVWDYRPVSLDEIIAWMETL